MADGQGQKLRWWQDEEGHSQAAKASERVIPNPTPLLSETLTVPVAYAEAAARAEEEVDTWAELEAEAARRVAQAKNKAAEPVSFYTDKAAALVRHRREVKHLGLVAFGFITLFLAFDLIVFLAWPHHHHRPPQLGIFGGFAVLFFLYQRRRRWLVENENPTLRLTADGLFLNTWRNPDIVLPWSEVAEVNVKKRSGKERYLEIRATKRRRFVITELDLPLSTEAVDARFAVDQNLTVPVDEIAAQITAYRVSINGKSGTVSAD